MIDAIPDEGVYVNFHGEVIRDVRLQWGEAPSSIGKYRYYTVQLQIVKVQRNHYKSLSLITSQGLYWRGFTYTD